MPKSPRRVGLAQAPHGLGIAFFRQRLQLDDGLGTRRQLAGALRPAGDTHMGRLGGLLHVIGGGQRQAMGLDRVARDARRLLVAVEHVDGQPVLRTGVTDFGTLAHPLHDLFLGAVALRLVLQVVVHRLQGADGRRVAIVGGADAL